MNTIGRMGGIIPHKKHKRIFPRLLWTVFGIRMRAVGGSMSQIWELKMRVATIQRERGRRVPSSAQELEGRRKGTGGVWNGAPFEREEAPLK